jgi:hypothetical protein
MLAGVHIESGVVDAFGGDRGYQGVMAMAGARWRAFELGAHLPAYRIELGSERQVGLGDVHVMGRYVALSRGETEIGGAAGVMLPVGDDEVGLGMGHWMAMAGGFVRGGSGPIRGELSLGYAGALGSAGHAEHGVLVWPPVAPMNAREVRADATVSATLWRQLGASVTSLAAIPLGDGEFIALVGGDITYRVGRVTVTAGARHGLAHHTLGLAWSAGVMGAL